jgi:lipopolysaccharide/colanic/teichoic acid biosynthesis glycosyltransferase
VSTMKQGGLLDAHMQGENGTLNRAPRPALNRLRVQFSGLIASLILGVMLPAVLGAPFTGPTWHAMTSSVFVTSMLSAGFAATIGYVALRQMGFYPGANTSVYALPTLFFTFSGVAIALLMARVEYSRYVLVAAFVASTLWLTTVFFVIDRRRVPTLAVIPAGNEREIMSLGGVKWKRLASPLDQLDGVDSIVVDLRADLSPSWERFIARAILGGVPVYDVKNVLESLTGRVDIEHLSENGFGGVLPSKSYLRVKRLVDLLLAAFLLPLFLPIIAVAALAVKLESEGPAMFVQQRIGYGARSFSIYKLRSMRLGGSQGQAFTAEADSRVTRVGRLIRNYRIDEMPQIFNIIKGDMSWIGPRPEANELAEWYARDIPFYIYRHAVRPGISGWAQVNQGNVAEIKSITVKLQYDFYYAKNFSPTLDLLIFIKTIGTVVTGFGSR